MAINDDEVRELIGRTSAAQRQGFHVTPAMIARILAALRFYLAARTCLAKPHADRRADPHDDAPDKRSEPYTGPPATIGDLPRHGLVALTVTCDAGTCGNGRRILFDALPLDDATPFPDIPQWRGFRCSRCGLRRVRVSPDWTDHVAQGNGRSPPTSGPPSM